MCASTHATGMRQREKGMRMLNDMETKLERKFCRLGEELTVKDGTIIKNYTSLFRKYDQNSNIMSKGAYATSLKALTAAGRRVKMLWQHDPTQPINI